MSADPNRDESKHDSPPSDESADAGGRRARSQSATAATSLPPPNPPPKPVNIQCASPTHDSTSPTRSTRTRSRSHDHSSLRSGVSAASITSQTQQTQTFLSSETPRSPPLVTPAPVHISVDADSLAHPPQDQSVTPLPQPSTPRAAPAPDSSSQHAGIGMDISSHSPSNGGSRSPLPLPPRHGASHRTQYMNRVRTHSLHHSASNGNSSPTNKRSPVDFQRSASLPPSLFEDDTASASPNNTLKRIRGGKKRDSSEPRVRHVTTTFIH